MADVVAPGSQATTSTTIDASNPHGIKRAAETSLDHEQRLSKRFDLLNLFDDNGTRLYYGVPSSAAQTSKASPSNPIDLNSNPKCKPKKKTRAPRSAPDSDTMAIEDTPHRVYIADLAAELSDIESDEDTPIFLPDIEKHLSKIPRHLLRAPDPTPKATEHNQVVLYNVPTSLSVPAEKDGVRKAIVEARRRIREGQASAVDEVLARGKAVSAVPQVMDEDDDAMDID